MLLAIDISNTSIKVGIFQETTLVACWRLATEVRKLTDDYATIFLNLLAWYRIPVTAIQGVILSCVVPPLYPVFQQLAQHYFKQTCLNVKPNLNLAICLAIDNPAEVGSDRIATAVALYQLYGGPAIAITFGTATVFDCIDVQGNYLGGAIAPGMTIAMDALAHSAALLYQVDLSKPPKAIGTNTRHMLQSGTVLGYTSLVEGLVQRLKTELGNQQLRIIASGWLAELIMPETALLYTIEQPLLLHGLRLIYEANASSPI